MKNNSLQQLRALLEGKTVLKIEEPHASEAICKFVLSDGSSFRLHATELGFWTEKTKDVYNEYPTLHDLATDYGHHIYYWMPQYNYNPPAAKFVADGEVISFISPADKVFKMRKSYLSDVENNIINHPQALSLLLENICMGDMWQVPFMPRHMEEDLPLSCQIIKSGD